MAQYKYFNNLVGKDDMVKDIASNYIVGDHQLSYRLVQNNPREYRDSLLMKKQDSPQSGTATEQMLDCLAECIRYGISVCVAGATSSGKTTLLGWLLTTIPDGKRIYSIENGSRELALVRRKEGRVVNSVIHTLTRDSENERQRVDQIALLDMALRFNPDIIVVGEMRGPEANAAQEAARTGVAVVTTIHSMSCDATYRHMVSLCKRAVDIQRGGEGLCADDGVKRRGGDRDTVLKQPGEF